MTGNCPIGAYWSAVWVWTNNCVSESSSDDSSIETIPARPSPSWENSIVVPNPAASSEVISHPAATRLSRTAFATAVGDSSEKSEAK